MFSNDVFKNEDKIPLLSLPDISKWNTQNVTDMSDMFRHCQSLSSLILKMLKI